MKKVLLSAALIVTVAFGASAQKSDDGSKLKFSAGLEAALPIGDFGEVWSFGIGGSAQVDYNVSEGLDLTLNAGVLSYSGKTVSGFSFPSITFIPVLAGTKYAFTEKIYGSAQLGLTFISSTGSSTSGFTFAPGVGFKFTENLDALVKYTSVSGSNGSGSFGAIGVRVAYTF